MKKLSQIVALEKQVRQTSYKDLSKEHTLMQKPALCVGQSRVYRRLHEDGEQYPAESQNVAQRVEDALTDIARKLGELFDLTASKDMANMAAKADVIVDGKVLVKGAPVPFILFLEKQGQDLYTLAKALPTLDPAETWTFDANRGCYVSGKVETARSKKVKRALVKYPATTEHPAQTETYDEDVIVGYWETIKFSGAIGADRKRQLVERIESLQKALHVAREEANSTQSELVTVSKPIFEYLFAK